jgi:hypothetical protein
MTRRRPLELLCALAAFTLLAAGARAEKRRDAPPAKRGAKSSKKKEPPPPAEVAKEGKIRVVRGMDGPQPQLSEAEGKHWLITGPQRGELTRVHGHLVKAWGVVGPKKLMQRTLKVSRYEILDAGGHKPLIGMLAEDGRGLRLEREAGALQLTGKPRFLRKLRRRLGCKVWVVGEFQDEALRVFKFGWLNCKKPKPIKPKTKKKRIEPKKEGRER